MGDIPLTEKQFLELLDEKFKEKLKPIRSTIDKLQGFQDHEAHAIEFELEMILHKYLTNKYPLMSTNKLGMKFINDPYTTLPITELDAAFLLKPYEYSHDYSRLREAGLPIPQKYDNKNPSFIFILAEAKHYIHREKIAEKLYQFDRICEVFTLVYRILNKLDDPKKLGVTKEFLSTVQRNKFLANIKDSILFFGAGYWQKGLFQEFKNDINEYIKLVNDFKSVNGDNKLNIYKRIIELKRKWYGKNYSPSKNEKSSDDIIALNTINDAIYNTRLIQPSGDRFIIQDLDDKKDPMGISTIPIQGGMKTRKIRR
jgi:hypothetical protein